LQSSFVGWTSVRRQVAFSLTEAAEGKSLAEQLALNGPLDGVVDGVLGWVTGSSDPQTAYSITMIGLSTARDVAFRTAVAAFDVASLDRGAEAERLGATANQNRILSDVQAYRDEFAKSQASNRTPPMVMTPEFEAVHAQNRLWGRRQSQDTLTSFRGAGGTWHRRQSFSWSTKRFSPVADTVSWRGVVRSLAYFSGIKGFSTARFPTLS
jgi:hypothetical protein